MSRTDEILYTGMTSASFAKQVKAKKERASKKRVAKNELKPAVETILNQIAAERTAIANELANLIHLEMNPEDVKSTVLGLRLADQKLQNLERNIGNALRIPGFKDDWDI